MDNHWTIDEKQYFITQLNEIFKYCNCSIMTYSAREIYLGSVRLIPAFEFLRIHQWINIPYVSLKSISEAVDQGLLIQSNNIRKGLPMQFSISDLGKTFIMEN